VEGCQPAAVGDDPARLIDRRRIWGDHLMTECAPRLSHSLKHGGAEVGIAGAFGEQVRDDPRQPTPPRAHARSYELPQELSTSLRIALGVFCPVKIPCTSVPRVMNGSPLGQVKIGFSRVRRAL
jgi:hypothetical protein